MATQVIPREEINQWKIRFWTKERQRIGMSIYTPQIGEDSAEMLTPEARRELVAQLPGLRTRYPKFWMVDGVARAFEDPPSCPSECTSRSCP